MMAARTRLVIAIFVVTAALFPFAAYAQPGAKARPMEVPTRKQIAQSTFPSVVLVVMHGEDGKPIALASGFFVRDAVVATSLHVIADAATGYVRIVGKEARHPIQGTVGVDRERDLALLKVANVKAQSLRFGDASNVAVGDDVYVVGNPEGFVGTFSQGIVSGIRHTDAMTLFQITAPISKGSSGGPVLDSNGRVIGVAFASFTEGQNLNFAIPVSYLGPLLAHSRPTERLSKAPPIELEEATRLWLPATQAFAQGDYAVAQGLLELFVDQSSTDSRVPVALLMLGKARFALGDFGPALDALRRAAKFSPPPGLGLEARFWEGETLFRLKRFSEARDAYDEVLRTDATAPFAPDALYGYGWTELELGRTEPAVTAFRDLLLTWPEHSVTASAAYQLARLLVDLKRAGEAIPLLADFKLKYPTSKLGPDAQYLLGRARIAKGDTKGGVADLKAFVEANPSHERATTARRLIETIHVQPEADSGSPQRP